MKTKYDIFKENAEARKARQKNIAELQPMLDEARALYAVIPDRHDDLETIVKLDRQHIALTINIQIIIDCFDSRLDSL